MLETVRMGASRVVVNLTETTFFDSSATHALVRSAERRKRVAYSSMSFAHCQPQTAFRVTGVDRIEVYALSGRRTK